MSLSVDINTQKNNDDLMRLMRNIEYHHKALNVCATDFPYRSDIISSTANEYAELGHRLYQTGRYEEAIRAYLRAREYDPDHFQSLNQLGMSYSKLQRYKEARECFQEISDRAITSYDFHHKVDAELNYAWTHIEENKPNSLQKAEESLTITQDSILNYPFLSKVVDRLELQKKLNQSLTAAHKHLLDKDWRKADKMIKEVKKHAAYLHPSDPNHEQVSILEMRLRDAISTKAFTATCHKIFFSPPVVISPDESVSEEITVTI